MIATAAESNPTCFSSTPMTDLEENLVPPYLRLVCCRGLGTQQSLIVFQSKYLDNHWSLTKFCIAQFKGTYLNLTKAEGRIRREAITKAKGYDDVSEMVVSWTGEEELREIANALEARIPKDLEEVTRTPPGTVNPEPPGMGAPFGPSNERIPLPALVTGLDVLTPTPTPLNGDVPSMLSI
jgi:tRNA-dihydrouridine synthase 2